MARGRPKQARGRVQKDIGIREDLAAKVDLLLYSELEQRVPYGAWSKLIEGLLEQWLQQVAAVSNMEGQDHASRSDQGS